MIVDDKKPCPACGEEVKLGARKCKHCGELLGEDTRKFWRFFGWTGFKGKTLWDFLRLLIVPIMLFGLGIWFNQTQSDRQREIEQDRSREAALQNYYDEMTELLLQRQLRTSKQAQDIARARTLAVLRNLDGFRKGMLIRFLHEAELIQVSTSTTETSAVSLGGANLRGIDLRGIDLSRIDLSRTDLSDARLHGTDLRGADLGAARLHEANLNWADLVGADLKRANLTGADLSWARLSKADLCGVDLREADLRDADLREANLCGADLRGADLSGADLVSDAYLRGADLSGARYNHYTQWPDGFTPPSEAIEVE